jgi:hypothetical protein
VITTFVCVIRLERIVDDQVRFHGRIKKLDELGQCAYAEKHVSERDCLSHPDR